MSTIIVLACSVVDGMRRLRVEVISLCFIAVVASMNGYAKILVVDKNDDASFNSISEALECARDGDTIVIEDGEYREVLDIKKRVALIGEGNVRICPKSMRNGYAILVRAEGVRLEGLDISNRGEGLYAQGIKIVARNTRIIDCSIHDVPVGIAVWSSDNTIENCRFWNCDDEGIVLIGVGDHTCSNNKIVNCSFVNNRDGIEIKRASDNIIMNCSFSGIYHDEISLIGSHKTDSMDKCLSTKSLKTSLRANEILNHILDICKRLMHSLNIGKIFEIILKSLYPLEKIKD